MDIVLSVISRNFFIVINRNPFDSKELNFDVNFFYLRSFKEDSFKFSYVNKPFFKGNVIFGLDFKDKMRPLSFLKTTGDNSTIAIDPRLFKKFILNERNKFIAFSNQTDMTKFEPVRTMLENFHYDNQKVIELTLCQSCLEKRIFKILSKKQQIKSYNKRIICSDCALDLILKEARQKGLLGEKKMNPKLKNFFKHMILKFRDVLKVLNTLKVSFDPLKNSDLTLYDIEQNPPISKKFLNLHVEDLDLEPKFRDLLKKQRINTLLPIQALSLDRGLISEYNSQLIMAPTSAGKTLVGEIAGVTRILRDNLKMLYLVPIVALANVRTEEFTKKYENLNLKIVKKIGESILDKNEEDNLDELYDANIIIATYEAIDYIIRGGNKGKLGPIGTIVIDEIQTLIDVERGFILDGLIARLKYLYPKAQFLYLSATIGAPDVLAKKLDCALIRYNNRPVPIERHLILCLNETIKNRYIISLVKNAFSSVSKFQYKGQSIIFTNTRKKCENLAEYLSRRQIRARPYHSGLTHDERKEIEIDFKNQRISAVVATAALAAGVDFPAKQVIFESLGMGIKILTVAEFEQMLGRAGRLKKHEKGFAYLLVEPGKIYNPKMKITEENIAISLLNGKIKDFQLDPNGDRSLTELLAFISAFEEGIEKKDINHFYNSLINGEYELESFLKQLLQFNLIKNENYKLIPTRLGTAISKSFLTVDQGLEIANRLENEDNAVYSIVLELNPLKNVYLSKKVVADLSKNVNMKYFSNNFFSASTLNLMDAEYVKKRKKFSQDFIDLIIKWTTDIFNCTCKDNPYCDCGRINLEKMILRLRTEENLSVEAISSYLLEVYNIMVFKGDLIDYLESLIYSLESILNIAKGLDKINPQNNTQLSDIPNLITKIKY
jgi:archaea-specific helicase